MEKIFISFRSSDTQEATRSIYQSLSHEFGKDSLFYFPESNFAGDRFVDKIFSALGQSTILIAVIGREYVTAKDDDGNIRIFNENDLVRKELAFALENKMTVIPILVGNTPFPKTQQLPPDIQSLLDIDFQNIDFNKGYDYGIRLLKENIYRNSDFKQTQDSKNFLTYLGISLGTLLFAGFAYFVIDAFGVLNPKDSRGTESTMMVDEGDPTVLSNPSETTVLKIDDKLKATKSPTQEPPTTNTAQAQKNKVIGTPKINTQSIGTTKEPIAKSAPMQEVIVAKQAAAKPTATNYFLSDQKFEVGVFQCGETGSWDFSKTISNFFNKQKRSSSNQIFNTQFKRKFLSQIKSDDLSGFKHAAVADKLTCLFLIDQDVEKSINEASGLTILQLNARIRKIDLQSYTTETDFTVDINANGTSEQAAIKNLEKRFLQEISQRGIHEKICR